MDDVGCLYPMKNHIHDRNYIGEAFLFLTVGKILRVWDGSVLQTMTVLSIDSDNQQFQTDWAGDPIASTSQWSINSTSSPSNITISVEGISGVSSATLRATGGHAPFDAARDVGRWVRVLQEDQDAAESADLGERFQWHSFKINSVTSATEAVVDWSGGTLPATASLIAEARAIISRVEPFLSRSCSNVHPPKTAWSANAPKSRPKDRSGSKIPYSVKSIAFMKGVHVSQCLAGEVMPAHQ